jgi:hypothetical protein
VDRPLSGTPARRPQGASAARGCGENAWAPSQQRRALSSDYSFRAAVSLPVTSSESARRRDVHSRTRWRHACTPGSRAAGIPVHDYHFGWQSGVVIAEAPSRTSRRIAAAVPAYCRFQRVEQEPHKCPPDCPLRSTPGVSPAEGVCPLSRTEAAAGSSCSTQGPPGVGFPFPARSGYLEFGIIALIPTFWLCRLGVV